MSTKGTDTILDRFIGSFGTGPTDGGIEDATRCLFYEEQKDTLGSAVQRYMPLLPCFEEGEYCPYGDVRDVWDGIVTDYKCSKFSDGTKARKSSITAIRSWYPHWLSLANTQSIDTSYTCES